jgi:23S rRNA (uracil-5-)-methyltransferase RumA
MEVRIEKIVYPGKSLSTFEGKFVFCDEGLPGETVEVKPVKEKKNYIQAETVKVLKASPHRAASRCAHYRACSPYQYIDYPFQVEIKKSQIKEIFSRSLKVELKEPAVKPSPKIWGYRNKVRLHLTWENKSAHLAYHQPGFEDEFVRIEKCFLISDRVNSLLASLLEVITGERLTGIEEVEVRESSSSQEMLLLLYVSSSQEMDGLAKSLSRLKSKFPLKGLVFLARRGKSLIEAFIDGQNFIEEKVAGNIFRIGSQSFFQINGDLLREVSEDLKRIVNLSGRERIADLYCGVGTFGIILAPEALEVFGVEESRESIGFLKENLALNQIANFTVCEGQSEEWIPWILKKRTDVLIVDPPRKGIAPGIVKSLLRKPVSLIVYLSCNPSTLARDLKLLFPKYRLRDVRIYDFFPHTPHIETFSVLEKI